MTEAALETQDTSAAVADAPPPAQTLEEAARQVFGETEAPAEPAEAEAAPVEESKEEPPEEAKPLDRVSARIVAAKRAEAKVEKARLELRAEKDAIAKQKADLDAREKRVALIEEDPVRFFEEWKKDPKEFLEKLAGTYKPESVAVKKADAAEARIAELEQKLAAREAAQSEAEQRAQAEHAWKSASQSFIFHVETNAMKYPHLVEEFNEAEATDLAFRELSAVVAHDEQGRPVTRVQAYFAEHGTYPDDEVVADYLDKLAKQRIEARQQSVWRKRGESAPSASQAAPSGEPKAVPSVKGTSPRTLTSREASQKAAAPKPWSQEAADEESMRILEAALRKA